MDIIPRLRYPNLINDFAQFSFVFSEKSGFRAPFNTLRGLDIGRP